MEFLRWVLQSVGILSSQDEDKNMHPAVGAFIPVDWHDYLDGSFYLLLKGEHVAYEVYDRRLLGTCHAAPGCDGTMESTSSAEAVNVCAVILSEVEEEADGSKEKPPLLRKYEVGLGEGRTAIAPATKLYRFLFKDKQKNIVSGKQRGTCAELVKPGIAAYQEIRHTLKEAQQLPNEEDRRRVCKRLILKWHVDEDDCDKSCNHIVQALVENFFQEEKLKLLFHLECDERRCTHLSIVDLFDSNDEVDARLEAQGHEKRQQTSQMFFVHKRNWQRCLERKMWDVGCNPQRLEGQRWFRQAQADLQTALSAMGSWHQGFNWICFLCHQAFEKGLKALLYFRDANQCSLNIHSLCELSSRIDDPVLMVAARDMEALVGRHTGMRYPDLLEYPHIPAEVYSAGQADQACRLSHQALQRIGQLLH